MPPSGRREASVFFPHTTAPRELLSGLAPARGQSRSGPLPGFGSGSVLAFS